MFTDDEFPLVGTFVKCFLCYSVANGRHRNSDNVTATFIKELPSTHTLEDVLLECNQLTNCKQVMHAGRYYLKEGDGSIFTPAAHDSWSLYVKK